MNRAIADTGPPIHLNEIGRINLLEIFESISVSEHVRKELNIYNLWDLLKQNKLIHLNEVTISEDELKEEQVNWKDYHLQKADISVLILAKRIKDDIVLTDDMELRKAVESISRFVIGSVGVLTKGYKTRKLDKEELNKGYRIAFQ